MNLELIINNNSWKVIIIDEWDKKYYKVDPTNKKLYISNMNVDLVKYSVWQNHHEPYKENYIG